jgi:hypothetical protein
MSIHPNRINLINDLSPFEETPDDLLITALINYFTVLEERVFDPLKIYNVVGEKFVFQSQIFEVQIAQNKPISSWNLSYPDFLVIGNQNFNLVFGGKFVYNYDRDDSATRVLPAMLIYPSKENIDTVGDWWYEKGRIQIVVMLPIAKFRSAVTLITRKMYGALYHVDRQPMWGLYFQKYIPGIVDLSTSTEGDFKHVETEKKQGQDEISLGISLNYRIDYLKYLDGLAIRGRSIASTAPTYPDLDQIIPETTLITANGAN